MLIYANLNIIFIGSTFIRCVMDVALNPYIEGGLLYLIIFCFMLIVVLFVLVFGFTCFHFWLIFTARTSLEYCEKWKKKEGVENNITNFDEGIPFLIRMADGEKYEVNDRLNIALGRTHVVVIDKRDLPHMLPLLTMTR